ncbi:MAG TPA: response regulator [Vicinamibacteria bacterium]|nr:response regulator [Vicinamibacteria bacterium]
MTLGQVSADSGVAVLEMPAEHARVLVVDDEMVNIRLLERLLRGAGYTEVRGTTDAREAVALFREMQPDLVLLDLRMPYRDGYEVLAEIRSLTPPDVYLPVLVLTADPTGGALQRALSAGANDFLAKPFDAQEVVLRIRNLLQTRGLYLALQHQNRVLEQRVQERTQRLLQMEKLSAMGQLLAGVAHELNNPLAVISGQTQLLRLSGQVGPMASRLEKIAKAAERSVRIVRNFLALARERPPERTGVDLNTVAREAVELLAYELRTDNVEVLWDLAADLPLLSADPHQLHQVVVNLAANAHQAMLGVRGPHTLRLSTAALADRPWVRLEVADTGGGIPAEHLSRIFEPFFTTKPPGKGTGLGLSLSYSIVQEHEGTIQVQSEPGVGTKFVIELPVGTPPSRPRSEAPAVPATATGGPKRILVVDDERDVAMLLADLLQADGHEVETAANGAVALEMLARRPYDAILSDTKMPVMDGQGFFSQLERRHPALCRRIAFLTGDVLSADKRTFLAETGAPMLMKPFGLDEVRRVVNPLLGG